MATKKERISGRVGSVYGDTNVPILDDSVSMSRPTDAPHTKYRGIDLGGVRDVTASLVRTHSGTSEGNQPKEEIVNLFEREFADVYDTLEQNLMSGGDREEGLRTLQEEYFPTIGEGEQEVIQKFLNDARTVKAGESQGKVSTDTLNRILSIRYRQLLADNPNIDARYIREALQNIRGMSGYQELRQSVAERENTHNEWIAQQRREKIEQLQAAGMAVFKTEYDEKGTPYEVLDENGTFRQASSLEKAYSISRGDVPVGRERTEREWAYLKKANPTAYDADRRNIVKKIRENLVTVNIMTGVDRMNNLVRLNKYVEASNLSNQAIMELEGAKEMVKRQYAWMSPTEQEELMQPYDEYIERYTKILEDKNTPFEQKVKEFENYNKLQGITLTENYKSLQMISSVEAVLKAEGVSYLLGQIGTTVHLDIANILEDAGVQTNKSSQATSKDIERVANVYSVLQDIQKYRGDNLTNDFKADWFTPLGQEGMKNSLSNLPKEDLTYTAGFFRFPLKIATGQAAADKKATNVEGLLATHCLVGRCLENNKAFTLSDGFYPFLDDTLFNPNTFSLARRDDVLERREAIGEVSLSLLTNRIRGKIGSAFGVKGTHDILGSDNVNIRYDENARKFFVDVPKQEGVSPNRRSFLGGGRPSGGVQSSVSKELDTALPLIEEILKNTYSMSDEESNKEALNMLGDLLKSVNVESNLRTSQQVSIITSKDTSTLSEDERMEDIISRVNQVQVDPNDGDTNGGAKNLPVVSKVTKAFEDEVIDKEELKIIRDHFDYLLKGKRIK